jgi:hypothetical protein
MTTIAERGRAVAPAPAWLSGQWLLGAAGVPSLARMLDADEQVRPSGVESTPVISHSTGPTRKRFRFAVLGALPDASPGCGHVPSRRHW